MDDVDDGFAARTRDGVAIEDVLRVIEVEGREVARHEEGDLIDDRAEIITRIGFIRLVHDVI